AEGEIMSEAATRWISPFWGTLRTFKEPEGGGGKRIASAQSFIFTLGAQGKQEVHWYDAGGSLAQHDESTPKILVVDGPFSPNEQTPDHGWLRITSTSPVLPWGVTPAWPTSGARPSLPPPPTPPPGIPILWVNMVFYREDPMNIPV